MALTKELVENPALWRLSLLVGRRSLEVFAHPKVGDASAVGASLPFDAAAASPEAAFEEAVYANPLLLQPFGKIDIVVDNANAIIVPGGTDIDAVGKLFRLDDNMSLRRAAIDERNDVMFAIDRRLENFIGRTYDSAAVTHTLAVLGRYYALKGRRANASNMIVNLGAESVDILVFNRFGLVMARHFDSLSDNDATYYILAIFKQAGMDAEADEVLIAGNANRRLRLIPALGEFLDLVLPAIFPATAYHGDPVALKAAPALTLLPLCDSPLTNTES